MKTISIQLAIIAALVFSFAGCKDDNDLKNLHVTAVKQLYEPNNGKSIVLESSANATLYFEWEHAKAEDSGMVLYEIAFDREGANFSNPVYRIVSDNNGGYNHATVTHKQLNKIADLMGIGSAQTGKFQWTVFSSKGINEVKAEETRIIEVTRLAGFAEPPVDVYLTGEGSEGGANLSNALIFKSIASGEFEIFTKLEAGKNYSFVDAKTGTPRNFYADGGKLKEGALTNTVSKTGVYKISLDFSIGSMTIKEVIKVGWQILWWNRVLDLDYAGLGVWKKTITITDCTDGNGDNRYKFKATYEDVTLDWIAVNSTDGEPSGNENYFYVKQDDREGGWRDGWVWKVPGHTGWNGHTYEVELSLKADSPYTHKVTKIN
jgi:hypothetical protein